MINDEVTRVIQILRDVESSLGSARTYANRAAHDDASGQARRARNEIDSALSEIERAIRKLKTLS
jgi:hypothetical protein